MPNSITLTNPGNTNYTLIVSTKNSTVPLPQSYELTFSVPVENLVDVSGCSPSISDYVYADIHALSITNGKLYAGSDGGIYSSPIPTGTTVDDFWWEDMSKGLGIMQYYAVDANCPCACINSAPDLQDIDGNMTITRCVNDLTSNGFQIFI